MNIDDYESLPTTSVPVNMGAGAIAGVLEHCIMYPLDSVKTRMQSMSPLHSGFDITTTFRNMINKEGLLRPIRGVTAVVAGAGPAHALYFGSYELTKEFLTKFTTHNNLNYMASGALATLIHDAISNPTEVIKQRMQMYDSPYRSVMACLKGVYKNEGLKAFYRSYSTQLVMNIPYQTIHFTTYEFFQNMLNHDRRYNPLVHMAAGGAAGACAAAITTPLDVVKTLLNTQETGFIRGMPEAVRQIYHMAGPSGFFRGLTARVLYAMPATAICWSTYEFFKFYFCGFSHDHYKSSITGKSSLQPRDTSATLPLPGAIVAEAALLQKQRNSGSSRLNVNVNSAYVLPATTVENAEAAVSVSAATADIIENKEDYIGDDEAKPAPATTTTTATSSAAAATTAVAAGAIKTVCELSSVNVGAPAINLHTRHTDVKSPFERGYTRT